MSESDAMQKIVVFLADATVEEIESDLDYGDSRSEWIREACRQRLDRSEQAQN